MHSEASKKYLSPILAGGLLALLAGSQASAAVIDLNYVAAATAVDYGPQDGIFDAFSPFNLGSVNNNGYTSFRTALEFDISALPSGSKINAATLKLFVGEVEGTRQVALNSYAGNGSISLSDFSLDGFGDSTTLTPTGWYPVAFDVTPFLNSLISSGGAFAGFNLREDPANLANYTVLSFGIDGTIAPRLPRLSIEFVPEPSGISLFGAGLVGLFGVWKGRRRRLGVRWSWRCRDPAMPRSGCCCRS